MPPFQSGRVRRMYTLLVDERVEPTVAIFEIPDAINQFRIQVDASPILNIAVFSVAQVVAANVMPRGTQAR